MLFQLEIARPSVLTVHIRRAWLKIISESDRHWSDILRFGDSAVKVLWRSSEHGGIQTAGIDSYRRK